MKYSKVYDSEKKKYIDIEDFTDDNKAEWYDCPRYYANENLDSEENEVLGYIRKSVPFRRSNMRDDTPDIVRAAHFSKLCNNTAEERDRLTGRASKQESNIHKLTKEIGKSLKLIKIPKICVSVAGYEITMAEEQFIPLKFIKCEYTLSSCGIRADIAYDTEILGVEQKIFVEIFYKHRVDSDKRNALRYNKLNCVEVDVSDLRENLDTSVDELKRELEKRITYESYWVSSNVVETIERELGRTELIEMTLNNGMLKRSIFYGGDFHSRAFAFKDTLKLPEGHRCHIDKEETWGINSNKYINVGVCKNCNLCVRMEGYDSKLLEDIRVVCMANDKLADVNKEELIETVRKNLIDKYRNLEA